MPASFLALFTQTPISLKGLMGYHAIAFSRGQRGPRLPGQVLLQGTCHTGGQGKDLGQEDLLGWGSLWPSLKTLLGMPFITSWFFPLCGSIQVQSFLLHFWQGMPPHMLPVLGSSTVVNIVGVCDSILYKAISGVLMPTVLQALPDR